MAGALNSSRVPIASSNPSAKLNFGASGPDKPTSPAPLHRTQEIEESWEVQVNSILDWLTKYSPPVVLLLALGGMFIFVSKQVTENVITANFEKYKKEVELRLQRRSNFEERVLLDRYNCFATFIQKLGE